MKKILTAIAAASLLLTFSACSDKNSSSEPDTKIEVSNGENSGEKTSAPVSAEVVQPFVDYFDGFNEKNPDKVISATTPQVYIDEFRAAGKYDSIAEDITSDINATIDYWTETYGENPVGSYVGEISNQPLTEDQLKLAELSIKYTYYDTKLDFSLSEGYEVNFRYKTAGANDSVEAEETACFVRVNGDGWKLIPLPASALSQYEGAEDPFTQQ